MGLLLQIKNETIKEFIELIPKLQKEMEKNSDGYINIKIESIDYPIPSKNWTEDIDC